MRGRQRLRNDHVDPAEHEGEECRDTDAGPDQRYEDAEEESRQGIAVQKGRFIDFPWHAGHEPLQYPDGQWQREQGVGNGYSEYRVEQMQAVIELEIRNDVNHRR